MKKNLLLIMGLFAGFGYASQGTVYLYNQIGGMLNFQPVSIPNDWFMQNATIPRDHYTYFTYNTSSTTTETGTIELTMSDPGYSDDGLKCTLLVTINPADPSHPLSYPPADPNGSVIQQCNMSYGDAGTVQFGGMLAYPHSGFVYVGASS